MRAVEGIGKEETIYKERFSTEEERLRDATWKILVPEFFQRYIPDNATVMDIGAGDGHFIRNVKAKRKIAVDLSEHARELQKDGIETLIIPATEISKHCSEKADVVFMSNFLEHLPNKSLVLNVLEECKKVLKPGGLVLILQPNIRYVGPAYWDYIDHHIALTEYSLEEALKISGFKVVEMIPQFLPYTAKSKVGRIASMSVELVRYYLRAPFLWKLFGKQTFVVARA